ncbi:MAG TPA: elongation factor G [Caulifigura sp.]|nr:elongation factor G [Caulifigura sp.]
MSSPLAFIRNLGISAHIDSGKTTLSERILFYSGRIHKMNEVKGDGDGATMDFMDLEKERGITITSAATQVKWSEREGRGDFTINLIDTPGHVDFTVEVERSLRVLDGAILVLCAVGGVQSQSLTVDRQMKRYGIPRIAFINKMDRTGADAAKVIKQIKEKLGIVPLPIQLPMGSGAQFEGIIDLIKMRALYFEGKQGETVRAEAIPEDYADMAKAARTEMLESLSMFDDNLMTALLEEAEIDELEIHRLIREATLAREIVPVMLGTAFKNKGVQELIDAVCRYLPSPEDRTIRATDLVATHKAKQAGESGDEAVKKVTLTTEADKPLVAMAFKTVVEAFGQLTYTRIYQGTLKKGDTYLNSRMDKSTRIGRLLRMHADDREDIDSAGPGDIIAVVGVDCASGDTFCGGDVSYALESIYVPEPVIRLSIQPAQRDGADKLSKALERFRREDPTFRVMSDPETNETIIAGMGQLHLEIYVERIKREYKCDTIVGEPKVAYRETPTKTVEFNFKHKKQTGGSGQYAHIVGVLSPLGEDATETFIFENEVTQGRIPKDFIPPVEYGMSRALPKGPLSECEVVGVRVQLQDGSYHDVDSSQMSFEVAGFNCMRESLQKAGMALLEPIMKLEVETPDEYTGSLTGHLSSKRGVITGTDTRGNVTVINAEVPLASMFDYANELRSMTQGKAGFSMEFSRYKQVPRSIQEEVVERRAREKKERQAS